VIPVDDHEEILRRFSIRDDAYVDSLLGDHRANVAASALDPKTHALVRLGALIAIDAAPPSYLWSIESAHRHGASDDEIVGTLIAVMPAVGVARVVSAAPQLGLALGYDVGAALEERLERDRSERATIGPPIMPPEIEELD
jgi:alkylhydroperoxidase/carboxymuconolactone decarboxylase family protein YurZ